MSKAKKLLEFLIERKDSLGRDIPIWGGAVVYHSTSNNGYKDIQKNGYRILGDEAEDGQGGYYGEAVSFSLDKEYSSQFGKVLTSAKLDKDIKILNLNDEADWAIYQNLIKGKPDLSKLRDIIVKAGYDGVYDVGAGDLFLYNPGKAKLIK
jgi:hypothetical protein